MTIRPNTKRSIAKNFDGCSGEHELSLMSACSVLPVLDCTKYNLIEIGIMREGAWLTGQVALAVFEQGQTETLLPASLLPDSSKPRPYIPRDNKPEKIADIERQIELALENKIERNPTTRQHRRDT